MSSFSESALEKKLSELSNSQQSVQTLSLWLIHHRKHAGPIVSVWHRELRKGRRAGGLGRRRSAPRARAASRRGDPLQPAVLGPVPQGRGLGNPGAAGQPGRGRRSGVVVHRAVRGYRAQRRDACAGAGSVGRGGRAGSGAVPAALPVRPGNRGVLSAGILLLNLGFRPLVRYGTALRS